MAVLADDDVIVHRNPEWPGDVDDRLGQVDVGARRRWIIGRMRCGNEAGEHRVSCQLP